jgi:type II secretory pathway component PulF
MGRHAAIYRTLAHLHGAGIPWPQAVESATGGAGEWSGVRDRLSKGASVAQAFEPVADALDTALLKAGETSGGLQGALAELASTHEDAARRRAVRRTRAAYPVVLAHVAALLLPLPDLLAPSPRVGAALAWSLLVLAPVYAVMGLLRWADRRTRPPPDPVATPPKPLPAVGPFAARVEEADARALEALARLHDAGVPMDEATRLAARAGWGGRAAVDLHVARGRALCGEDVGGAWSVVPAELGARLRAAEHAGELAKEARATASDLRFRADQRSQRAIAALPVLLMALVGGVIAWRVISFYVDYYGRIGL